MEIDFLIRWNKKVSDEMNLAKKVKEMMDKLFLNLTDDTFNFNTDDTTLNYKCSEKNNQVYLKITSEYSDAKSAKLLSAIRDLICKGDHRKDYYIICTYDGASLSYCCRLMEPMGTFERHLRKLMYIIVVKAFGVDWVSSTFPKEMINEIKKKEKDGVSNQKMSEKAFELLDFGQIIEYLFSERYFVCSAEQVLEEKLSDEKLNTLSRDKIISVISNNRKNTLWNKLFSNKNIECLNYKTLNLIREKRNDVMHQHTLDENKYKEIKTLVKMADKELLLAIETVENRIYTETDLSYISNSLRNVLSSIIESYSNLISKIDWNSINSIGQSFIEASETFLLHKNIDFKNLGNALKNEFANLPDYSKLSKLDFNLSKGTDYSSVKELASSENANKNRQANDESDHQENTDNKKGRD